MCISPRKITNPTRFYYKGATKREIIVPCGHCYDCRAQKAQDWHLRIWSEVKRYNDLGGKCIFVTLTYMPECLPYFEFVDEDGSHKVPCFSKRDKNRFLNTMRKSQERLGFTGKDGLPVRYIWTCEYGDGKRYYSETKKVWLTGTYRPHYHVILMFPPELVRLLNFQSENQWKKYIQEFWHYGWCRWSKPQSKGGKGIFVYDEFAGEYVSKYMLKDLDFYNNQELQKFLFDKDGNLIKQNKEKMKDRLPTHWQSLQFGSALCEIYNNEDALLHGVDFHLTGDIQKGRSKKNRAPRYIRRKLLYIKDSQNQRYIYSENGLNFVTKEFELTMSDRLKKWKRYFSHFEIKCLLSDDDVRDLFKDYHVRIYTTFDLCNYFNSQLQNRSLTELYLYDMVWSGLIDTAQQFVNIDDLDLDTFYSESLNQYYLNNNKYLDIDAFNEEGIFKGKDNDFCSSDNFVYYDSCSRFYGFADIIKCIHMCDGFILARTHRQYLSDRENKLSMNHELLEHQRRLGSGFHHSSIGKYLTDASIERRNRIMARLRAK